MKRFFVICFFLCCCFIHIAAAKVDTLTVYSQAMKKDVNSLVILPDSYPEAERFPAIYLLHGYSDAWNSGWLRYCDGLENLIDQYRIIVICPTEDSAAGISTVRKIRLTDTKLSLPES